MRDFHRPGRSPVYARRGMVATSHPLASGAALATLKSGGNAVDAAITASAVLCVAEPHMTGVGGDCFCLIAEADGTLYGLNGSGRSAGGLTADDIANLGTGPINLDSGVAVTVPGAVDAWARLLASRGTIGLDRALAPAIELAEAGVPVAPRVAHDWVDGVARLEKREAAKRHLLKSDGTAPQAGDVVAFPALARTLRRIADAGPDGFYRGPVADDIVQAVAAAGGFLTQDDLLAVAADEVRPLVMEYRDVGIAELPPNGQGIAALMMLAILSRFDLARLDPIGPERLHLEVEAARLAYHCRDRFVSDPASAEVEPHELIAEEFIDRLAARIDPSRRINDIGPVDPRTSTDTVYLCVVDADGTAVSFINSLFHPFGSAIVAPESGVLLQNRGAGFVLEPGHPNRLAPSKRPMHTLIPGLLMREGRPLGPFGVMGGQYQACGHGHFVGNLVDFGMDPQAALDAPRAFFEGEATVIEDAVPQATVAGLAERGHDVAYRDKPLGGGQAILIDRGRGVLVGGSDPRKDGCAIGF